MSPEGARQFSREEAETLLPRIKELLLRAQELLRHLDQEQVEAGGSKHARRNGHASRNGQVRQESGAVHPIAEQLQDVIEQIQALGVVLRDIRTGLIDFPALREGIEVYLCWKLDEPPRIEWWHPTTTGIAGRRRISERPDPRQS